MPFSSKKNKTTVRPILRPKQDFGASLLSNSQKSQLYNILRKSGAYFSTTSWCGWSKRQKALLESLGPQFLGLIQEDENPPPKGVTGFPSVVLPENKAKLFGGSNILPGFRDVKGLVKIAQKLA